MKILNLETSHMPMIVFRYSPWDSKKLKALDKMITTNFYLVLKLKSANITLGSNAFNFTLTTTTKTEQKGLYVIWNVLFTLCSTLNGQGN